MAEEEKPLSSALGHEEIRADPLGDRIIAQGVYRVLVEMMNFMNRFMGHEEDETPPGADDRALETLDFSGDEVVQEPILQGWRAPRPEAALSPAGLEDWPKVVASMEDRYFEPAFVWDVLPNGTIAYSDSSAYAIRLASPDGSVTDVLRRPLSPQGVSRRIRRATIDYHLDRLEEWSRRPPSTGVPFIAPDVEGRRRRIQERGFYHEIPVVLELKATWDGGLWIQRRGEDPMVGRRPDRRLQRGPRVPGHAAGRRPADARRIRTRWPRGPSGTRRIRRADARGEPVAGRVGSIDNNSGTQRRGRRAMVGKTTQQRTGRAMAIAMATLSITVLAALAGPLAAQAVVELPAEDLPLDADFFGILKLGSVPKPNARSSFSMNHSTRYPRLLAPNRSRSCLTVIPTVSPLESSR